MTTAVKANAPKQLQQTTEATDSPPLAWLTLETLLYGLIFGLAVVLRFWRLGAYPLSGVEAGQALAGLALYLGQPIEAQLYSPLLLTLNSLSFLLFSHSDAVVRVAPALLGSSLVLLPLLLRRQLGPKAALLASALLAISPTAIFLSRTLNSDIAAAVGVMLIVAGFFNWAASGRQGWLYVLAGGLAVLLTSGPMAYSMLVVFTLVVALRWRAFKVLWPQGMAYADELVAAEETSSRLSHLQRSLIFFGVALLLLATAGTLNFPGFGVTTSLLTDWLSRFSFTPRVDAGFNGIFLLTIYEPLLVIAGVVGVAYAVLSRNLLRQSLAIWFLGAVILDVAMAGRTSGAVLLLLTPLVLLAGLALAHLWDSVAADGRWGNEGIILAAGLVIVSFGYIGLTGWLARSCGPDDMVCNYAWLQSVAALALFVVIVAFFWFIHGAEVALRGTALTGVVIGIVVALSFGWRLNYGPLMRQAFQPLNSAPSSTELVALRDTLTSEALIRTGDNAMLDVALVGVTDPALRWQLRTFKNLTTPASLLETPPATAIITPYGNNDDEFNLGEAYLGQDFAIKPVWSPVGLSAKDLVYWLIYRELPLHPDSERVILWLGLSNRG